MGIQPRDARDFVRMLRAMIKGDLDSCDPEVLVDVGDRRTLRALLERSGLAAGTKAGTVSCTEFFRNQQFVSIQNEGLILVQTLLNARRALNAQKIAGRSLGATRWNS